MVRSDIVTRPRGRPCCGRQRGGVRFDRSHGRRASPRACLGACRLSSLEPLASGNQHLASGRRSGAFWMIVRESRTSARSGDSARAEAEETVAVDRLPPWSAFVTPLHWDSLAPGWEGILPSFAFARRAGGRRAAPAPTRASAAACARRSRRPATLPGARWRAGCWIWRSATSSGAGGCPPRAGGAEPAGNPVRRPVQVRAVSSIVVANSTEPCAETPTRGAGAAEGLGAIQRAKLSFRERVSQYWFTFQYPSFEL